MRSTNKGKTFPAEPLTQEEVNKLLGACSRRSSAGIRNAALIALMYRSGIRIGEALRLCTKDLDLDAGTARILHGKGDRSRLVAIDAQCAAFIDRWLLRRKKLGLTHKSVPVFCTISTGKGYKPGEKMCPDYVRSMLPRIGKKAGIQKRVHAHGLRHTHAFELASEGIPIHIIQKQLGHSNVGVTDRYISHLCPQDVIEVMQSRSWRLNDSKS